jgi:hypothetical protein
VRIRVVISPAPDRNSEALTDSRLFSAIFDSTHN